MKKRLDKASVHNGRANSRGVAYNANHNTLEQSRLNQPHIDPQRIGLNRYIQYLESGASQTYRGGEGGYDSRKHERERYEQLYGKGLNARNERYRASGHKERAKTLSQVYRDPKTAPMETIFQLGKKGSETDELTRTRVLADAWGDVLLHLHQHYKDNLVILDASLHRDETNDHIHFRYTLGATDKFGHFVPNQSAALEAMGFDGRNPATGKKDRYHNPLIAFSDEVREVFYQACERRGIQLDREVTSGSRRQLDLLAQKCSGLQKEVASAEAKLQSTKEQAETVEEAVKAAMQKLDDIETEQMFTELEADNQRARATEAANAAKQAEIECQYAKEEKARTEAAEAAIREKARYDAEVIVRQLQDKIKEKDSIISKLTKETEKLRSKMLKIKGYLQEKGILQDFFHWIERPAPQRDEEVRER